MKRTPFVVLALTVLGLTPVAHAQSGDDALRFSRRQPLFSAVTAGSAGAGVSGTGTFADLFLNPAGLALMDRGAFSVGLGTLSATDDGIYSVGSTGNPVTDDIMATRLTHLAWTYKVPTVRGSMVFAAGLARQNSFDRRLSYIGENPLNSFTDFLMPVQGEFELREDNQGVYPDFSRTLSFIGFETYAIDFDDDKLASGDPVPFAPAVRAGTTLQNGTVTEEGGMTELSFGGAFEASKGVMVGLSVNIPFGSYDYYRMHEEADLYDENDGTAGTTDFNHLRFIETFSSSLVGVSARAGLSAILVPGFRLGLSVETPTVYSVDEDYDTRLSTAFDNGDRFEYGDDYEEDAGRGTFQYEVTSPWRVGAGLSYDAGPVSVTGEATLVDWSALELNSDTYSFADENFDTRQGMRATVITRFGLEYRLPSVSVRGGVAFDPDPRESFAGSIDRSRTTFGAGASYALNRQLALDLGWAMERFDDAFGPYTEVDGAPVVSERVSRHFVQFGLRFGL